MGLGSTHAQYGIGADIVWYNRVTAPIVLPVLCQLPAGHHAALYISISKPNRIRVERYIIFYGVLDILE